jgi:hypothetical protein
MGVGKFVLHRFNGDEEFEVQRATILAVHGEAGFELWFDADTDGVCLKSLSDTESLRGRPKAEVDPCYGPNPVASIHQRGRVTSFRV